MMVIMMIFHKYRKIHTLGNKENVSILDCADDEIIVEEKIDGANFRAAFSNGILRYGSRTLELMPNTEKTSSRAVC